MSRAAGSAAAPLLRPAWTAPAAVGAAMSTRAGGVSAPPLDSLNLGRNVGDAPEAVDQNRARFGAALGGATPLWLSQVHGTQVRRWTAEDLAAARAGAAPLVQADAAWTDAPGLACCVLVADCLPVLLADRRGRAVAAAHAGWRGLAGGVLEATLDALQEGAGVGAPDLVAWIGPGIGPDRFEVGDEVVAAFGDEGPRHARAHRRADGTAAWLLDLAALASWRLRRAGLAEVQPHGGCTASDAATWFSHRRDGRSGRMAAAVWLRSGARAGALSA